MCNLSDSESWIIKFRADLGCHNGSNVLTKSRGNFHIYTISRFFNFMKLKLDKNNLLILKNIYRNYELTNPLGFHEFRVLQSAFFN